MTTKAKTTKKLPTIVRAYRHRDYPGRLILQAEDGSCCIINPKFNAFSEREFIPRSVLERDKGWRVTKVGLHEVEGGYRAPVKGRPLPEPLATTLTGKSIAKRRAAEGLPPLKDWLTEYIGEPDNGDDAANDSAE